MWQESSPKCRTTSLAGINKFSTGEDWSKDLIIRSHLSFKVLTNTGQSQKIGKNWPYSKNGEIWVLNYGKRYCELQIKTLFPSATSCLMFVHHRNWKMWVEGSSKSSYCGYRKRIKMVISSKKIKNLSEKASHYWRDHQSLIIKFIPPSLNFPSLPRPQDGCWIST